MNFYLFSLLDSCRAKNHVSGNKSVSMILKFEMISVVSYKKEKTLLFLKKNLNLRKIILLVMFLVIEFFLTIISYQFFKNNWTFAMIKVVRSQKLDLRQK